MVCDPSQIKIRREALLIAEQALRFSHSDELDEATRRGLARAVLTAVAGGHSNVLVIASIALRAFHARPAAETA